MFKMEGVEKFFFSKLDLFVKKKKKKNQ